jgi:hypothetical protein
MQPDRNAPAIARANRRLEPARGGGGRSCVLNLILLVFLAVPVL